MKIAFVLSRCHNFGSSRNVIEVSKYLSRKGHEIHIFANSCDDMGRRNIIFHKVPSLTSKYLLSEAFTTFFETVMLKKYNFDVAVSQPARYLTPDICHVRFVSGSAFDLVDYKKNAIFEISEAVEKYNLKECRKIIAMSDSVKNDLVNRYKIDDDKISVVYDGVDANFFKPADKNKKSGIRKSLGIGISNVVLLFIGNPFSRKGLEYVIRALPLVKNRDVRLLVSGNDNPAIYKGLAKKLGADEKIIWNIGLTNEINKFFAAADIFVFPTLYEPFGLVITEAMASGLPVITSKIAGAAELIEDGKNGLLLDNPKNPEEIAEKINHLIDNSLFRKMGKAARAKAETLTWDRTANEMLKVFEEVRAMKEKGKHFPKDRC